MHIIEIDRHKKRLYITLSGLLIGETATEASEDIMKAIDSFDSEFDVITDISQCRPTAADGQIEIEKIQRYALSKGAKRFIRVVGERVLAQMQLERTGKQTGVEALCVSSIEAANKMLDN